MLKHLVFVTAAALATLFSLQPNRVNVVLLSIDGLKPEYVIDAEKHGLKIPNLRKLISEGAYATGVVGVTPTVTYPSHTTMLTGVSPARHGIFNNTPFDPFGKNLGGWYWYAEDIQVPTLWSAATRAGLKTGSVDWPASVGAPITFNLVQYWRAENAEDRKLIRALSTPGLLDEIEKVAGRYPVGNDYSVEADEVRTRFSEFILEQKKPDFHTAYFSGFDTVQHENAPFSAQAVQALERLDPLVGRLRRAAQHAGSGATVFCVVSDHGFAQTGNELHINAALQQAGLIQLDDQGKTKSWKAFAWYSGGSAAVMLSDQADETIRTKTRQVLRSLQSDPANGIRSLLEGAAAEKLGGFPQAAFVVDVKPGYRFGSALTAPVVRPGRTAGTHGYLPDLAEMRSSFFIVGSGVPSGKDLGKIDMRDIAPTLGAKLKVSLPGAEGRNLLP